MTLKTIINDPFLSKRSQIISKRSHCISLAILKTYEFSEVFDISFRFCRLWNNYINTPVSDTRPLGSFVTNFNVQSSIQNLRKKTFVSKDNNYFFHCLHRDCIVDILYNCLKP